MVLCEILRCQTSPAVGMRWLTRPTSLQVPRAEISAAAGRNHQPGGREGHFLVWIRVWYDALAASGGLVGVVLDHMDSLLGRANSDGGDSPGGDDAQEVWHFLAGIQNMAPTLRMLLTSRSAKAVPSSSRYLRVVVGALEASAARELLCCVAPNLRGGSYKDIVDKLVSECGGFPIALRAVANVLGAGRCAPADLLAELAAAEAGDAEAVVSACLRRSWCPKHSPLLHRLAALNGAFDEQAASAVLEGAVPDSRAAFQSLRALAAAGLLQECRRGGAANWYMTPALRQCASTGSIDTEAGTSNQAGNEVRDAVGRSLLALLCGRVTLSQNLLHERVAGWAAAALMSGIGPLLDGVLCWASDSLAAHSQLAGSSEVVKLIQLAECRAVLAALVSADMQQRLAGLAVSAAELTADGQLQGRARVAAAAASARGKAGPAQAMAAALRGLETIQGAGGGAAPALADAHLVVAELAIAAEDADAALQHYQSCLDIHETAKGEMHTDTGRCQNNIGGIYTRLARWNDAELAFRSALHCFQVLG